jgi:hypothetical protein
MPYSTRIRVDFAGAVLADECVDLTTSEVERDVVVGNDAGEAAS